MAAYLKIENPGIAPTASFTLLGASTKRDNVSAQTIGQFGSGNKHGVAVLLRAGIYPIVFCGNLRMEFYLKPETMKDKVFQRVCVKYSGKDESGKTNNRNEELGYVLEYGATDWPSVDMALREFVSNAIDASIEEGENNFLAGKTEAEKLFVYNSPNDLVEYRKVATDYNDVVVEVDSSVRAKSGSTRVFIPANDKVLEFQRNIGKWFLHFSEPEMLTKTVLPKKARNITHKNTAVIYRRGVRVREIQGDDSPSLFDYNLDSLKLDESRNVDDYTVRYHAARALSYAESNTLCVLMRSFLNDEKRWEHCFDASYLVGSYDTSESIAKRNAEWAKAIEETGGSDAVITSSTLMKEVAEKKGYRVILVPQGYDNAANALKLRTPEKVISEDERNGIDLAEANQTTVNLLNHIWSDIVAKNMANGRDKPTVMAFHKSMSAGSQILGFYRNNVVYIHSDIIPVVDDWPQMLKATMLEELAHHVTQATDMSRDLQDWLFNYAAKSI